jgi:hypothetical protein
LLIAAIEAAILPDQAVRAERVVERARWPFLALA